MKYNYLTLALAALVLAGCAGKVEGPCDIYEAYGTPCVAAHSTTRVLYSKYHGPLYQVMRESDGKTLDIGTIKGGYADAAAQDMFLEGTIGFIVKIYDQSGNGNDLTAAAPGTFLGPAKGEFNTVPIADMAPAVLDGHKVYGAYFMPGMGLRNNNASYLAINDEPEGIYYVIDGTHFDSGCCFDYGNSSTNGKAVGRGTMETTYYGISTAWGRGNDEGPWIMADMEAGLFSGFDAKQNDVPAITDWRFVSAYVNGGGGNHWDLRGGDATTDEVVTFYDGVRPVSPDPEEGYYPMSRKGGLLLANGGDNGNGSAGTFYEGAMTVGYPSEEAVKAVQANIAAARYTEQTMWMSRLTSFHEGVPQTLSVSFLNTTDKTVSGLDIALELPQGWSSERLSLIGAEAGVKPGEKAVAMFRVEGSNFDSMGFAKAVAKWNGGSEFASQRVRSIPDVCINEIYLGGEQFIELYNSSIDPVDLSGWEIEITRSGWAPVRAARLPQGTLISAKDYLVLRPSAEALAFDAAPLTKIFIPVSTDAEKVIPAGSTNLSLVSVAGIEAGQKLGIDLGGKYEEVTVSEVGTAATQTILMNPAKAGDTMLTLETTIDMREGMEITISTGQRKEVRKIKRVVKIADYPQPRRFGQPVVPHEPGVVEIDEPLSIDQIAKVDVWTPGTGITVSPLKYDHKVGDAVSAPAVPVAKDGSYSYTFSTKAGAVALYHDDVLVDAVIYGSKQSNSSANGTICRPDLAVLEGEQVQGGCLAEVPQFRMPRGGFVPGQPMPVPPTYSLVRIPDGHDRDVLCEIGNTETPTPGAANQQ